MVLFPTHHCSRVRFAHWVAGWVAPEQLSVFSVGLFVSCAVPMRLVLLVLLQGDDWCPCQAMTILRRGSTTPPVVCVFLYYRFYYKGTIGVHVKP